MALDSDGMCQREPKQVLRVCTNTIGDILPLLAINRTRSLLAGAVESLPTAAALQRLLGRSSSSGRVGFDGV